MGFRDYRYIFIIFTLFVGATAETDIFLPAMTDIMAYFQVGEAKVQGLLTWNFIGMCLMGPISGPLSDVYGRRRMLLVGFVLFFAGSLITVIAEDFHLMLTARLVQGLGCGVCFSVGTAVIFDVFEGRQAVQAIARLNTLIPLIVATAPLLGAYLNLKYGFRSNFLLIAALAALGWLSTAFFLEETRAEAVSHRFSWQQLLRDYRRALSSRPFMLVTAVISILFGIYMAFLATSSILFVKKLGVSREALPFFQGVVLLAWLIASLLAANFAKRFAQTEWMKKVGALSLILGALGFFLVLFAAPENPHAIVAAMAFFGFGFNWVQTVYFAESLYEVQNINGVTGAIRAGARMVLTAAAISVNGWLYNGTIYPIAVMLIGSVIVSIAMLVAYEKGKQQGLVQA